MRTISAYVQPYRRVREREPASTIHRTGTRLQSGGRSNTAAPRSDASADESAWAHTSTWRRRRDAPTSADIAPPSSVRSAVCPYKSLQVNVAPAHPPLTPSPSTTPVLASPSRRHPRCAFASSSTPCLVAAVDVPPLPHPRRPTDAPYSTPRCRASSPASVCPLPRRAPLSTARRLTQTRPERDHQRPFRSQPA